MELTIGHCTSILTGILKTNAPVRTSPLGAVGRKGTPFYSPYPGNLKANGIEESVMDASSSVVIGEHVGYASYTEYTSHKKGWMERSVNEFLDKLRSMGGRVV